MGLDQYAYKVKKGHITSTVDFTFTSFKDSSGEWEQIIPESDYTEIAYWRKHTIFMVGCKNFTTRKVD